LFVGGQYGGDAAHGLMTASSANDEF
jgi:hypothetical protein